MPAVLLGESLLYSCDSLVSSSVEEWLSAEGLTGKQDGRHTKLSLMASDLDPLGHLQVLTQ